MDFLGRPQNGPKWLPTMKMAEIQKFFFLHIKDIM